MPDVAWLLLAIVAVVAAYWGYNKLPDEIEYNFSLHITWEALIALVFGVFSAIVVALLLVQGGM